MLQDFKYAVRSLLRVPAFTLAVILTLALGIGAAGGARGSADRVAK